MTIKHSALLSLRNKKHKGRYKDLVRAPLLRVSHALPCLRLCLQGRKRMWGQWRDAIDGGVGRERVLVRDQQQCKRMERMERMKVSETLHNTRWRSKNV